MGIARGMGAGFLGDGEAEVPAVLLQLDLPQGGGIDCHVPFRLDLLPVRAVLPDAVFADFLVEHQRAVVAHVQVHQPGLPVGPALQAAAHGVIPLALPLQERAVVDEGPAVGIVGDVRADVAPVDVGPQPVFGGGIPPRPVQVPAFTVAKDLRLVRAQHAQQLLVGVFVGIDGHLSRAAGHDLDHVFLQLHGPRRRTCFPALYPG